MNEELLESVKSELVNDLMKTFEISEDDSKTIAEDYIAFFKKKIIDANNYTIVQDYIDKSELIDSGDWRNDPTQVSSKLHLGDTRVVLIISTFSLDITNAMSFAYDLNKASGTDLKGFLITTVAKELVFNLFKIIKLLKPCEYCVYIHAEEVDRRNRKMGKNLFVKYAEFLPKCRGQECDNKPDKWKCPYEIENGCRIKDEDVFEIAKSLTRKNILSPGYDGTFKLNRW